MPIYANENLINCIFQRAKITHAQVILERPLNNV